MNRAAYYCPLDGTATGEGTRTGHLFGCVACRQAAALGREACRRHYTPTPGRPRRPVEAVDQGDPWEVTP